MIGNYDTYYGRQEVSNSDLSELQKYFLPSNVVLDLTQAYRFGNLFDAMRTESERCDHLRLRVDDEQFLSHEWELSYAMLKSLRKSKVDQIFLNAVGQKTFIHPDFKIEFEGFEFTLPMRCKYDAFIEAANFGGDYKTTGATSQSSFVNAFQRLDYDRSRALYMDLSGAKKDVVIGVSKVYPHRVFPIYITRDSDIYKSGKAKYQELAFKWWYLFENIEKLAA